MAIRIDAFLGEFLDEQYPEIRAAPWISLDAFDPPWAASDLAAMERSGVIEFNDDRTRYRLTAKALVYRKTR